MDCLFCKIINGEIPSEKVFENDKVFAFCDINPQAPVHILIVPKKHIASCDELNAENAGTAADIFAVIPEIAKSCGITNGYRVITNVGEDGCQSVQHIHFHLLGGKKLSEKMD